MSFNIILACFPDAKTSKPGHARAVCPAHGAGKSLTLLISENDNGSIRLHCFAGCMQDSIMNALGLDYRLAWKPRRVLNNAQWAAKNAWNARILAAIKCEIYHIQMIEKEDVNVIAKLRRVAPSVFMPLPRLDRDSKEAKAGCERLWWRVAIKTAHSAPALAGLLDMSFRLSRKFEVGQ